MQMKSSFSVGIMGAGIEMVRNLGFNILTVGSFLMSTF
jgi:hypothetical protein